MTSHCLIFLGMIWYLPSINAQNSRRDEGFHLKNMRREILLHQDGSHMGSQTHVATSSQNPVSGVTIDLSSWRTRHAWHSNNRLTTAHGIINIIGWGILFPIGVIIARYYKKLPVKFNDWYSLHVRCQTSGFILGTIGWVIGLFLRNAAKKHSLSTHGVLGTIIFTFTTLQVLAICLQPKQEHECRKYWVVYHHLLGYALIALIIANIFEGIHNQSPAANKWKWCYVAILGVLALTALALECFRWIKFIFH